MKLVPIQEVVEGSLDAIVGAAVALAEGIGTGEKFRVTVEKRHTDLSSKMIIDTIAKHIERKVDLDNPDKIVLVEVIGQLAGLALISSDDILSIEREKRKA